MAKIRDDSKMTSTGVACSLDGQAYIVCPSRQQEREENKRGKSVSGRRMKWYRLDFLHHEEHITFSRSKYAKATYLPDHNTQPFSSSHTSPRQPYKIRHLTHILPIAPCFPSVPLIPSHSNSQSHPYHCPPPNISHTQRFQSGFDSERQAKTRTKV